MERGEEKQGTKIYRREKEPLLRGICEAVEKVAAFAKMVFEYREGSEK